MAITVFLYNINPRPNCDALTEVAFPPKVLTLQRLSQHLAVPATEKSRQFLKQTTVETVTNMTPENRAHFESEKEAIHLILTGIGDEIYSTVDGMFRHPRNVEDHRQLQQGESLNTKIYQDKLILEFGQFTSHDMRNNLSPLLHKFYKMMN
ncbi:hypothetical protein Tco_1402495 [Tanacetum coccineum]